MSHEIVPANIGTAATPDEQTSRRSPGRLRRTLIVGALALGAILAMPTEAHAGIFGVFDEIFGMIKGPIGGALTDINAITKETQQLYQSAMWPLAMIEQYHELSRLHDERILYALQLRNAVQPTAA